PLEISPGDWDTRVFLFGPGTLPDSNFTRDAASVHVGSDGISKDQELSTDAAEEFPPDEFMPPDERETGASETDDSLDIHAAPEEAQSLDRSAIVLGSDLLSGVPVHWSLTIKGNPHLLVCGLPGMGKTTCLLNLCRQMLQADVRPIIFSYHEDIDERL